MPLPSLPFSMLHWTWGIPHRLWSTFQEGPPSIPVFLIWHYPLRRSCRLESNDGLGYVLRENEHAKLEKEELRAHTTEITEAPLKFAAPFVVGEWRGRSFLSGGFAPCLDRRLSGLWKDPSVRICNGFNIGKFSCISPVNTSFFSVLEPLIWWWIKPT